MKDIKKVLVLVLLIIFFIGFYFFKFYFIYTELVLGGLGNFIKKVPISIPYIIFSILFLYFLGQLSFFKNIQMTEHVFAKQKKSTIKEIFATILYGLILIALMIGFIILLFSGTN